ncbi:hypothetical protein [Frigoriflavimonas asaccharolytica]|uniref:Carboxypeptidase-like protein n=1 Tax=Frigoriflavimonas asaccharolytica TaxID=2735899 RepID=A0A8J8GBR6_9FLAO|nr:hypothetical protein [Frigoriflavimonas asaccharolytica]NRS93627.1 hypothetical protein [Frigoriflavimonas asaccharolytica]
MKKTIFLFLLVAICIKVNAQLFSGAVFLRDDSNIYLNQLFVTNLNAQKTVLSNYNGEFTIEAKVGETIRFTSIITERKDIKVTSEMLAGQKNLFELKISYYDIEEVVIARFKPTKNLRADVAKIKIGEKEMRLQKMIGLPVPKGNGQSPIAPVASFADGGLSISVNSIYDIISGDRKRKQRLYAYEKMSKETLIIKNYFGDEYFTKIKIPKNLIQNFLQFIYTSENLSPYIESGNLEIVKVFVEKYLPIYLKRIEVSNIQNIAE